MASNGSATLKNQVVDWPAGGADCAVKTVVEGTGTVSASAKQRKVKLGGSSFSVKAGTKGKVRIKLTKKGLKRLKRLKTIKTTVTITVTTGGTKTTKKVKVTLKAPKRKK